MSDASAARAHLRALASAPRPAGGEGERAARAHAAAALRAAGFAVREAPFEYSSLVGGWGTPIAGVTSMLVLAAAARLGSVGRPGAALGALAATVVVGGAVGAWAARRGVLDAPVLRRRGVNLEATRGGEAPRVWLVAHLDSKSQPVPIGVRAAGVTASVCCWVAALALGAAQAAGVVGGDAWPWLAGLGALAGLPVAASVVTARSPGALDDASGVATVLLAAHLTRELDAPLGVLLTSAEELGLAGARAWAAQRRGAGAAAGVALNVDGVDDEGGLTVMTGRGTGAATAAFRDGAAEVGAPLTVRRLVPGILVDAVALADAGWSAATLSRGTWRTLARIHTAADSLDRLDGTGIAEGARVLATAARRATRAPLPPAGAAA